ncbi:MAG: maleylpyruvate isomerase [Actinomycetota bacterium]|nr:maleylpyruvate isomerase [Actinomycetota bacterium]
MTPTTELVAAREATARMRALVDGIDDLAAPSLLPGWNRTYVVAHIAGNALGQIRMLRGAERGEIADQYPGGAEGRAAEIDDLARDPRAAVAALHRTADELDAAWRDTTDWDAEARALGGALIPVWRIPWIRWREVEVHAVDLAAGYRPADWPAEFVRRLLAELREWPACPPLDGITGPDHALAAWLSGRSAGEDLQGDRPDLPEWR